MRAVSGWIRTIKRMAGSVRTELEQELKIEQLQADLDRLAAASIPVDIVYNQGKEVLGL